VDSLARHLATWPALTVAGGPAPGPNDRFTWALLAMGALALAALMAVCGRGIAARMRGRLRRPGR
jgi:hypothetical protein